MQNLVINAFAQFPGLMAIKDRNLRHIFASDNYRYFFPEGIDIIGKSIQEVTTHYDLDLNILDVCTEHDQEAFISNELLRKYEKINGNTYETVRFIFNFNDENFLCLVCWDISSSINELKSVKRKINVDSLTKAYTREKLKDVNVSEISHLVMFDLDKFKNINDTFGHSLGDKVLSNMVQRLVTAIREGDLVVRMGGDEFLVVIFGANVDEHTLRERFDYIRKTFSIDIENVILKVNYSFCVLEYDKTLCFVENIKRADKGMYHEKFSNRI